MFTQAQKKELKALVRQKELKSAKAKLETYADKSKSKKSDPTRAKAQAQKEREIKKKIASLQQQENEVRKMKGDPIIIVPASASSMVTIHNAKDLLENGAFIGTAEIKKSGKVGYKSPHTYTQHAYKMVTIAKTN